MYIILEMIGSLKSITINLCIDMRNIFMLRAYYTWWLAVKGSNSAAVGKGILYRHCINDNNQPSDKQHPQSLQANNTKKTTSRESLSVTQQTRVRWAQELTLWNALNFRPIKNELLEMSADPRRIGCQWSH